MDDQVTETNSEEMVPVQEKQRNNTLTIVLGALLVLALAAVAFLLITYVFGDDADTSEGSGDEIFQPTAAPEQPVDLPLEGTQWYLTGVEDGTSISLVFSGDSISGFSGCNNYSSTYRSTRAAGSSNNISVGPISSGQAMCDESIMNQEQNYLSSLASARSYSISGNTLSLSTGISSLSFAAAQVAPRTE